MIVPANESMPGMSGSDGSTSEPTPAMRYRAANVPLVVSTSQRPASVSQRAFVTS